MKELDRETKALGSLDSLRQAQREVDEAATRHLSEAARLLSLAQDIERDIQRARRERH